MHKSNRPSPRVRLPQNLPMSAAQLLSTASTAPCTRSLRFACASRDVGSHTTKAHREMMAVFAMVVIADPFANAVAEIDLDRKRRTLWQMLGANNRDKPAKSGSGNT